MSRGKRITFGILLVVIMGFSIIQSVNNGSELGNMIKSTQPYQYIDNRIKNFKRDMIPNMDIMK